MSLKEGWDRISANYQRKAGIPVDDVYWGDFVATERQLGILGGVRGKRILEIGCGGAQNSIVLSKWGAEVAGLDLSRKQILYGRRLAKKEGAKVNLVVGEMTELPFNDNTFDVVTTAISLHYAPDLRRVVAEVNRVLLEDGYFVFSAVHPLAEGRLEKIRGTLAVAVRGYFRRRIERWVDTLPDGSRVKMHSYYRTLQDHFDALIENGFAVERYLEPERLGEDALHPLDREKLSRSRWARAFYRMMEEVPVWVIFKARKDKMARVRSMRASVRKAETR